MAIEFVKNRYGHYEYEDQNMDIILDCKEQVALLAGRFSINNLENILVKMKELQSMGQDGASGMKINNT